MQNDSAGFAVYPRCNTVIETTLVKRQAMHKGEIGFFPSSPMAEEDIALAPMNGEVLCNFTSPRTLQQLKFLWALVSKVAENSDAFIDKDDAMRQLKLDVGFSRLVQNKALELEMKPKSLKRLDSEGLKKLTNKIIDFVCREVLPGMDENTLRDEIESMIAPNMK